MMILIKCMKLMTNEDKQVVIHLVLVRKIFRSENFFRMVRGPVCFTPLLP